jgi:hypothetical protein
MGTEGKKRLIREQRKRRLIETKRSGTWEQGKEAGDWEQRKKQLAEKTKTSLSIGCAARVADYPGCLRRFSLRLGIVSFPIVPKLGTHFVLALSRVRSRGRIAKWVPKKEAADP